MKSYANGMDWVAAGLGAECAATPGGSNHFLLLLTLSGGAEPEAVRALLGSIPEAARALLHGRWVRAWHLAPYWLSPFVPNKPGTLHEVEYKKYRYGTLRSTRSSKSLQHTA